MKQLAILIITLYLWCSSFLMILSGTVLMFMAIAGFFSAEVLPWSYQYWATGALLILLGLTIIYGMSRSELGAIESQVIDGELVREGVQTA